MIRHALRRLSLSLGLVALMVALVPFAARAAGPSAPYLVLHRGGVIDDARPENSMAALEAAIAQGYPYVEFDLRITRDGQVVCLHDESLKRTLGLDLDIESLTLAELYAKVDPARVPTLEAFASKAQGKIALMPDVKGASPQRLAAYRASIRSILEKHGLMRSALFIGRSEVIETYADEARYAWRGSLEDFRRQAAIHPGLAAHVFAFNHAKDFTRREVEAYRALGVPVVITVNLEHYLSGDPMAQGGVDIGRALALGVDGLQMDSAYRPFLPPAVAASLR
ncbi:MAG: glycerophosphodiester phosphodiesterase [Caulobacteraceae bacterium]